MVEKLDVIAKPASCVASGSKITWVGAPDVRVAKAPSLLQVMLMRGVCGAKASKASNVPTLSALFPERPKLTTKGFAPDKKCDGLATISVVGTERVHLTAAAMISPI